MVFLRRRKRNCVHVMAPATGGSYLFRGGLSIINSKVLFVCSTCKEGNEQLLKVYVNNKGLSGSYTSV